MDVTIGAANPGRQLERIASSMRRVALNPVGWRRLGGVLLLCLIFSTQVLVQPGLFDRWSLDRIVEGWAVYFSEIAATGFAMLGGFMGAEALTPAGGTMRGLSVGLALPLSAALGHAGVVAILYSPEFIFSTQSVGDTLRMTAIGVAVAIIYTIRRRSVAAAASAHEIEIARQELAKQILAARLQLMEAQIEPHFLFNSLANVQRLYETDRSSGERLLENLKTYIRAALPQMREAHSTLGREVELARAYLEVLHARMDDRLRFTIDVPRELLAHPFPAMMLITLVENAIKHGINKALAGGDICVRARRHGRRVTVAVADTGAGFCGNSGNGVGLANIRARLGALFGDHAELSLCANEPSGVVATIVVPVA